MQINQLAIYGKIEESELQGVYSAVKKHKLSCLQEGINDKLIYISLDNFEQLHEISPWIEENKEKITIIVYIKRAQEIKNVQARIFDSACTFSNTSMLEGTIYFWGPIFEYNNSIKAPDDFKVLAIMHFYNEADILEMTLQYLLSQELNLYLVDNWSDDGSYEIARKFQEKHSDQVFLERYPKDGKKDYYDWYHQMERSEEISLKTNYNWYIHYDVDEMRISFWKNKNLRETIYYIDKLGYNVIENTVIDFKLTQSDSSNIFMSDTYFDFRHFREGQRKTWKKSNSIDLKKEGGHIAKVENPKIFPLKILNRHYPLRSMSQAKKKVFLDRKPRFIKEKEELGWHVHYDHILKDEDILENKAELILWDDDVWISYYVSLFLGCGIQMDEAEKEYEIPLSQFSGKKIVLYGAGRYGTYCYKKLSEHTEILAWIDKDYIYLPWICGKKIDSLECISDLEFDAVFIAIRNEEVKKAVRNTLVNKGIHKEKIF